MKPDNIEISGFGEVLVCDWGLARLLDDADPELIMKDGVAGPLADINRTMNGMVKGTPGYMAPEQAAPGINSKSIQTDIYSLGAILYSILTLVRPITGEDTIDVIRKTAIGDFIEPRFREPERNVPYSLNAVVCKAMSTLPEERYESVEALQLDVRAYLEGFATEAENAPFHRLLLLMFKRHAGLTVLTSSAIVMLTLVTTTFLQHIEEKRIELEAQNQKLEAEQKKSEAEKIKRQFLSANAAEVLIEKAQSHLRNYQYYEALSAIEKSLKLKPESETALELKAIILVGAMRYEEAEQTAALMKNWTNQYFSDMASKYKPLLNGEGLLSPDEFINLLREIQDDRMLEEQGEYEKFKHRVSAHIEQQLCSETFKRYSLEDRMLMLKELLELTNPQSGEIDLKYELQGGIVKFLTLNNNQELNRPDVLSGLPIEVLNLQSTGISSLSFARGMPLVKLDISDTSVHTLGPLSQCPLNELKLTRTPVTDISPVVRLPLRSLYLGSAKVTPLNFINDFAYLEKLYLPNGVYSQGEINSLDKTIEVIVN